MKTDEFAAEIHRRLHAVDQKEAEHDPHGVLMRIARQVSFHHPIVWAKVFWSGRQKRLELRDRERRAKQEKRE